MSLLTFDDIRLLPRPSDIVTRQECNTTVKLGRYQLKMPLIVASMHSLVTSEMIKNVEAAGSLVVQPRDMYNLSVYRLALSTGFDQAIERAGLLPQGGILSVEVANGYQDRMLSVLEKLRETRPDLCILAGTVCTLEGMDLLSEYADGVLMGIGVGNACTTTVNTGVGLPAAEMLMRLHNVGLINCDIVLCGGVRTYGDFVKAIALGADVVMSGYLFKDCADTGQRYYGEASAHQKSAPEYIEGQEIPVQKLNKTSEDVLREAQQALQSAMSYVGARTLAEFRAMVTFA